MAQFISNGDETDEKKDSFHCVTPKGSDCIEISPIDPDRNVGDSCNLTPEHSLSKSLDSSKHSVVRHDSLRIKNSRKASLHIPFRRSFSMREKKKDSDMGARLYALGLKKNQVDHILEKGEKYLEKPHLLAKKLKIQEDVAIRALDILKVELVLTPKVCRKINSCLMENPDIVDQKDISLFADVEEALVSKFFEMLPLNKKQEEFIRQRFEQNIPVSEIANQLNIAIKKVEEYIAITFVTFSCNNGGQVLDIIKSYCGDVPKNTLRERILSKNLKLQDQLYCRLRRESKSEYEIISKYLGGYEESENFLIVDVDLTMDEILIIKENSKENVEELSKKLNTVESVIADYIHQYRAYPVESKFLTDTQEKKILSISKAFGAKTFSLENYKTVITDSFDNIIGRIESEKRSEKAVDLLFELLPLIFHYLKCSLPFEDIARIFSNISDIALTTHDLFQIIFQLSDSVLRGLCIEHYSFSNPVPLYYPKLKHPQSKSSEIQFEICKELWYCLEQYNGLISFGLGRASWNVVGKSSLLDLIFKTDFVKGSPQSSAFHFRSIDIQLTKNLFGESTSSESTKWAYIDCHGYSDLSVIQVLCSHLDVALIHVCYNDYKNNKAELDEELRNFELKHIYILIRDSIESDEVTIERKHSNGVALTHVFMPNLSGKDKLPHSIAKSLKRIGYEIYHLNIPNPKLIQSQFLCEILKCLNEPSLEDIQTDGICIHTITQMFDKSHDFTPLNRYPSFVKYMSSYYKASSEVDQKKIDALNFECGHLDEELKNSPMSDTVNYLNYLLKQQNSVLLLWKLSRELSRMSYFIKLEMDDTEKEVKCSLEILWRESLLFHKYARNIENSQDQYHKDLFAADYSKHVESGEAFELIDGDNLRFFNKEIDSLLSQFYMKQKEMLKRQNKRKSVKIKSAPIVISIFGPQSSGKSTLLNYCFGCKFLTSAGRCTRGIYGSLSKLDRPVNLSQSFLILDTEGLDAIERDNIKDTSMIHFDRTMVLFCLAVSQVVIINIKGEIGSELQNLLQICAYSLNQLKVNKVKAPKIFFVLNQQAEPDPNKHLVAINILMEKLNSGFGLMETEGVEISDLIQISRENLFILPTAFNSQPVNDIDAKLFDSDVVKLSPTIEFARKCTNLRVAIIEQLDHMSCDDRAPFQNMSEWMEMAGVVWDTIIKHQDIVKYKNLDELKCSNQLDQIVTDLMQKHIYCNQNDFKAVTQNLCEKISSIKSCFNGNIKLDEVMCDFDKVFESYKDSCIGEFSKECQDNQLFRRMEHICSEKKSNTQRLIIVERKTYRDHIQLHIKSVLTEIYLSESMKKFQLAIEQNVEIYCSFNNKEIKDAFENIWKQTFGIEDDDEENREFEEVFSNLYSIFRMEYNSMENMKEISSLFQQLQLRIDVIIDTLKSEIINRFVDLSPQLEQFIVPIDHQHIPIKEMVPYNGGQEYSYLCQKSLYEVEKPWYSPKPFIVRLDWIPSECETLLQDCSGYYNHPDLVWKCSKTVQITTLSPYLINPNDLKTSTWDKFVTDISSDVLNLLHQDCDVSPAIIKTLIHALCSRIKLLNYEIGFIHASLSNTAERILATLVFAYAFKFLWKKKVQFRQENTKKKETEKKGLYQYFSQKIEQHKMILGKWDRNWMAKIDKEISQKYSFDFSESVKRGLKTSKQQNLMNFLEDTCKRESLSHDSMLSQAYEMVLEELEKNPEDEVTDTENFVVQYICNRNEVLQKIFTNKWEEVEKELYRNISKNIKLDFSKIISILKNVLQILLQDLDKQRKDFEFDSDNYFKFIEQSNFQETKKIRFKAMNLYLRNYLDPTVTPEEFGNFLHDILKIDGFEIKFCEANRLPSKQPTLVLEEDTFRRLHNTEMFNDTELIFNIYNYVKHFLSGLDEYLIELRQDEFQEMIAPLKGEFEKNMIGCPSQCPICGKFCEREIHTNEGKCQIKTGHQISSMGGKVWNKGGDSTAVLFMCDDYKDHTQIQLLGSSIEWGEFKDKCGGEWYWDPHTEENSKMKKEANPKLMKDIWNKFGRGILKYQNQKQSTNISFVPYTTYEEVNEPLLPINYYICFVIDGTGSMNLDITRVRLSVGQLISSFISQGHSAQFRVVIYRDHCDDEIIETFPHGNEFTPEHNTVEDFLNGVEATGGGDFPEAMLDGLATAATQSEWRCALGVRNKIIHIFDAPPHGDFPNYTEHSSYSNKGNCCCCNQGEECKFDWDRDVWKALRRLKIEYHAINTTSKQFELSSFNQFKKNIKKMAMECYHMIDIDSVYSKYETKMRKELGHLCGNFQDVCKEVVNDAILKIFVDYKKEKETWCVL